MKNGGAIVNLASIAGVRGGANITAYSASKGAVIALTRAFANELGPKGIRVNAIAPGYFDTNNTEALRADPVRSAEILGRIPAGRWGTPTDLQAAVVFLASPASDYMHGSTLALDGGWLAR